MYRILEKVLSYTPVRFLISGGLSAVIHIGIVFILSHMLSIWYLYATAVGFISAVGFNFFMQKFFTFRNLNTQRVHRQLLLFFVVATLNFFVNGMLMIFFVDYMKFVPVVAQVTTSILIAVWSFIAYGKLFRSPATHVGSEKY